MNNILLSADEYIKLKEDLEYWTERAIRVEEELNSLLSENRELQRQVSDYSWESDFRNGNVQGMW